MVIMAMRYRKLGQWGIKVSEVSLGAWNTYGESVTDLEQVRSVVRAAYEGGVNYFDNADVYARGEAERMMGQVLAEFPRHTLVLATKVFGNMSDEVNDRGLSRKHINESIHKSLRRMGTDYVDVYFAHRYDPDVPMEEIVSSMSNLIDRGLVLYWGTSQWPVARLVEAVQVARAGGWHPPVVEQPLYSMLSRDHVETQLLPETGPLGMGVVVYSPLAQGMLTGRYDQGIPSGSRFERQPQMANRYVSEANRQKVLALKEVAHDLGLTRTQLALAWILRQKGVSSTITGASRPEQITESLGGAGVDLSSEVLAHIEAILNPPT